MNLALGIDTGGTYTDAVLLDHARGEVVAGAKALTTRHDLSIGISEAIRAVLAVRREESSIGTEDIVLVALSTTLATNTIAEGHGAAVTMLLIGYDRALMERFGFHSELPSGEVVYLAGGHDQYGEEIQPLDVVGARAAILAHKDTTEAFAVSSYFSVRNPAHELRVRDMIRELTGKPVTCGHELTSRLNAVRRATTVGLNAHLILPLRELIASVQQTLGSLGIDAPLMVVKGDGSLMRAEWALERPIETVLSGPAASVVGAWHLAGKRDVWVIDVGGTTTDIGALRDGWPILNAEGASVAGWRTMVEAIDVHTTGLGGDSQVAVDRNGELLIGPRRVIPLSLLALHYPGVLAELNSQALSDTEISSEHAGQFLMIGRHSGAALSEQDAQILAEIASEPRSVLHLMRSARARGLYSRAIEDLEKRGLVRRSGFTPTDALHVMGRYSPWCSEAARKGAELMSRRMRITPEEFALRVITGVSERIALELVTKVMEDDLGQVDWKGQPLAQALLSRALRSEQSSQLSCSLALSNPLVAIGAPVQAYLPEVAERLHADLHIPPHAGVANAVGAVAGGIIQRIHVVINPLDDSGLLRVHLPDGLRDASSLEDAVSLATEWALPQVKMLAHRAGAEHVEVKVNRNDHWARVLDGETMQVYLGSDLLFTASGRPSPAKR